MSQIKLKHSGGNSVIIAAPDSNPASDRTLKLPSDADGTILTTNSATGKILQVVQTFKNDQFSTTATSTEVDITGFNVTITPSSSSNKILIMSQCGVGKSNASSVIGMDLYRGSTKIAAQATNQSYSAGAVLYAYDTNDLHRWSYNFLDTPNTTNAVTYQWKVKGFNSGTVYINNRGSTDMMTTGTVIAMEVAG